MERELKLNTKRTVLIGLAFMSISAFWQMYDNVVPLVLKNTFGMGEECIIQIPLDMYCKFTSTELGAVQIFWS